MSTRASVCVRRLSQFTDFYITIECLFAYRLYRSVVMNSPRKILNIYNFELHSIWGPRARARLKIDGDDDCEIYTSAMWLATSVTRLSFWHILVGLSTVPFAAAILSPNSIIKIQMKKQQKKCIRCRDNVKKNARKEFFKMDYGYWRRYDSIT